MPVKFLLYTLVNSHFLNPFITQSSNTKNSSDPFWYIYSKITQKNFDFSVTYISNDGYTSTRIGCSISHGPGRFYANRKWFKSTILHGLRQPKSKFTFNMIFNIVFLNILFNIKFKVKFLTKFHYKLICYTVFKMNLLDWFL